MLQMIVFFLRLMRSTGTPPTTGHNTLRLLNITHYDRASISSVHKWSHRSCSSEGDRNFIIPRLLKKLKGVTRTQRFNHDLPSTICSTPISDRGKPIKVITSTVPRDRQHNKKLLNTIDRRRKTGKLIPHHRNGPNMNRIRNTIRIGMPYGEM